MSIRHPAPPPYSALPKASKVDNNDNDEEEEAFPADDNNNDDESDPDFLPNKK